MASADLERLLEPDYLGDLQSRSIEEIRAMREECRHAEDGLSYVRRQAQGRLDIVASELTRRAEGKGPSDVFLERVLCCFINDPVGIELLHRFNVENVCWESDFPHSDSTWPNAPETLEVLFAKTDDASINKITHENAMKHYHFDPFTTRGKEQCTVAALRAEATDVDTVTRVGRLADERDAEYFRNIARRNLKPAATK